MRGYLYFVSVKLISGNRKQPVGALLHDKAYSGTQSKISKKN